MWKKKVIFLLFYLTIRFESRICPKLKKSKVTKDFKKKMRLEKKVMKIFRKILELLKNLEQILGKPYGSKKGSKNILENMLTTKNM